MCTANHHRPRHCLMAGHTLEDFKRDLHRRRLSSICFLLQSHWSRSPVESSRMCVQRIISLEIGRNCVFLNQFRFENRRAFLKPITVDYFTWSGQEANQDYTSQSQRTAYLAIT